MVAQNQKAGFVGSGFVAKFHAKALQSVRGVEVTGLVDRSGSVDRRNEMVELGVGDPVIYDSVGELAKNVEILGIFCPNDTRLEVLREVAESGASPNLVIEKPFARNMVEANEMVELIERIGSRVAYFENQCFAPAITCARDQLVDAQKVAGPPYLARAKEEHSGPHEPWFWDPTRQGGGVFSDMGCHSIASCMDLLTPVGESPMFLQPVSISCNMDLLLWGQEDKCQELLNNFRVDYRKTPAEDYASATIRFRNPETGQVVVAETTDSWCYADRGLRLSMEAFGPGYNQTSNTLISPSEIFIGDEVAQAVDAETMLEKSMASSGALTVLPNEPELYGYVHEWREALAAFNRGENGMLDYRYGRMNTLIIMAGYMSHERGERIDLTDQDVRTELETFIPKIQQGKGLEVLGDVEQLAAV